MIRRIVALNDPDERVLVQDLMTEQALIEVYNDLAADNCWSDAIWYKARAKELRTEGKHVMWDTVFNCRQHDLPSKEWHAFRMAQMTGRSSALVCIY